LLFPVLQTALKKLGKRFYKKKRQWQNEIKTLQDLDEMREEKL
jgi:hypothetical protein